MTFGIATFVGAGGQRRGHFAISFRAVALPDPPPHRCIIQPSVHGGLTALPMDFCLLQHRKGILPSGSLLGEVGSWEDPESQPLKKPTWPRSKISSVKVNSPGRSGMEQVPEDHLEDTPVTREAHWPRSLVPKPLTGYPDSRICLLHGRSQGSLSTPLPTLWGHCSGSRLGGGENQICCSS